MSKLLPDPTAPMYLNLHHYDKAVAASTMKEEEEDNPLPPKEEEEESSLKFPITGRRFLPHQMPVYNPRVEALNTIKVMEIIQGPLAALRLAMNEKRRVKVWTRRDTGMRGFLVGFIEAFDKHWNLALRDVDEVFYRKRRDKVTPNVGQGLFWLY
jgi:small nuclear ribonucleoprotein (snRNP)-like protein